MKKRCLLAGVCLLLISWVGISLAQEITPLNLRPPLADQRAAQNAKYLFEALKARPDVKAFFANGTTSRQALVAKLKARQHPTLYLPCSISAAPESLYQFRLAEILRVYLILDALEKGELISQIATVIKSYWPGSQIEPGGLGILKNGRLKLKLEPSVPIKPDEFAAATYLIPEEAFSQPHLFLFHMHPLILNFAFPGPSWEPEFIDGKQVRLKHDIGAALKRASTDGDHHHLLIADLGDKYFNLIYYTAERVEPLTRFSDLDFCPKLRGFRAVNLGKWKY